MFLRANVDLQSDLELQSKARFAGSPICRADCLQNAWCVGFLETRQKLAPKSVSKRSPCRVGSWYPKAPRVFQDKMQPYFGGHGWGHGSHDSLTSQLFWTSYLLGSGTMFVSKFRLWVNARHQQRVWHCTPPSPRNAALGSACCRRMPGVRLLLSCCSGEATGSDRIWFSLFGFPFFWPQKVITFHFQVPKRQLRIRG